MWVAPAATPVAPESALPSARPLMKVPYTRKGQVFLKRRNVVVPRCSMDGAEEHHPMASMQPSSSGSRGSAGLGAVPPGPPPAGEAEPDCVGCAGTGGEVGRCICDKVGARAMPGIAICTVGADGAALPLPPLESTSAKLTLAARAPIWTKVA